MTIWPCPRAKPAPAGRFPPLRSRPARPGRACAAPPRWRRRRGAAAPTWPRRAAVSIRSEPETRLPARASSPSRSSADCRSAASIRSPRSAGMTTSPVLNARASAALQLALGLRRLERRPVDPDPGAAAGRPGAHVGRDLAVRAEGEANQLVPGGGAPREDAVPLGHMAMPVLPRRREPSFFLILAPGLRRGSRLTRQSLIGEFPQPRPPRLCCPRPRTNARGRP